VELNLSWCGLMTTSLSSHPRRGTTITEFVVACTLLGSLTALVVPSAVRIRRLQQTIRHDRIAMDEVTNQLDRLTQLPLDQLRQEVDGLTPSEFAVSGLPNPKLTGTLQDSEDGYRLSLEISWDSPGRRVAPLVMATWVYPTSAKGRPADGSPVSAAEGPPAADREARSVESEIRSSSGRKSPEEGPVP